MQDPIAFLRVDAGQIRVLGTSVAPGTSSLDVTGDQVGLDTFETGTLTVTVTIVEQTTPPASAQARLEVSISGSFQDAAGATVYQGPVFDTVVGDVMVECLTDSPTESPSPSVSPSPTASPSPTPTVCPSPTPTATPTPSEPPTPDPTTPGPGQASPRTPAPPIPPPAPDGTSLPATGPSLPAWWGAVAVLAGAALVLAGGWRSRNRQQPG